MSLQPFTPENESPWPELITLFREYDIRTPFCFSAPELQIEPLFYLACRKHEVPACTGTVYNLPLALLLIREMAPDALVSQPELAGSVLEALNQRGTGVPFKLIYLFGGGRLAAEHMPPEQEVAIYYGKHPLAYG